jgi:hypothetical protein
MIKIITDKALHEVAEQLKIKPTSYHHICYAGTAFPAIDSWSRDATIKCKYKDNHYDVGCNMCNGVLIAPVELQDHERYYNRGIDSLVERLLQEHIITAKEET